MVKNVFDKGVSLNPFQTLSVFLFYVLHVCACIAVTHSNRNIDYVQFQTFFIKNLFDLSALKWVIFDFYVLHIERLAMALISLLYLDIRGDQMEHCSVIWFLLHSLFLCATVMLV